MIESYLKDVFVVFIVPYVLVHGSIKAVRPIFGLKSIKVRGDHVNVLINGVVDPCCSLMLLCERILLGFPEDIDLRLILQVLFGPFIQKEVPHIEKI